MTLTYIELEHAQSKQHVVLLSEVDRHGPSKSTICGPYQVLRRKDWVLFCHLQHVDSIGHSLTIGDFCGQ